MKLLVLVLVLLMSPVSVAASPLAAAERAMQARQSQDAVDLVARYRPARRDRAAGQTGGDGAGAS